MTETIFFRLLESDDKSIALQQAIAQLAQGQTESIVFSVNPDSFQKVPGSTFAYWAGERILNVFKSLPKFESATRTANLGLTTNNDFRFLRLSSELLPESKSYFHDLAKGGSFSYFYADIVLQINWANDGDEIKAFAMTTPGTTHWSRNVRSPDKYFRRGLTYPRRTNQGERILRMA